MLLAMVYLLAGQIGALFATTEGNITLIWPASGIALAALRIFGMRLWPGVLLGAFISNILSIDNIIAAAMMSVGSTFSAYLGAWLLFRYIGHENPLSRPVHLFKFLATGLATPIIAALIGTLALVSNDIASWSNFKLVTLTWWLGDAAGILVFSPLLFAWQKNIKPVTEFQHSRMEISLFFSLLLLFSALPFISSFPVDVVGYPLAFISFPFCIWAAYRYCMKQVAYTIIIIMAMAIYGTLTEQGPFYRETLAESLFQLQTFMALIVITTLSLAAAIYERRMYALQLVEQREKAERLIHEKSVFMSNMSHELRTPLNAIIGFSHILKQDKQSLTKNQAEFVDHISHAGDHLLHLVNDLLDIEQSNVNKLTIELGQVNLHEIITASLDLIKQAASDKQITIRYNNPLPHDTQVIADKTRLHQVLINLLSNATKYNHVGGSIDINCDATENSPINITINDSGEGIDEADIEKIFEPFNRAHTSQANIEGAGLGLTVTHKLITLMNGKISVSSTPGEGSAFTITIPRHSNTA